MSEINEITENEEAITEATTAEKNSLYFEKLKDLWFCMYFCIAGWALACIGFATNIIFVLLGVIVVDLPCFRLLLGGASLGAILGSSVGATRIITYRDGHKERDDSGWSAGLAVTIFTWLFTIIIGLFVIVFRIFKDFLICLKTQKEENLKPEIKNACWLPIVVGLGVFVIGLIIVALV